MPDVCVLVYIYVNVCSNVLGSFSLHTFGYVSPSTLTFALRLVQLIFAAVATSAPPGLSAALPLPSLLRSPLCTHNMTTKLTTNLTILTKTNDNEELSLTPVLFLDSQIWPCSPSPCAQRTPSSNSPPASNATGAKMCKKCQLFHLNLMPASDEDAERTIGRAATRRPSLHHNMVYVVGKNLKLLPAYAI
jgi:hypothetical protein